MYSHRHVRGRVGGGGRIGGGERVGGWVEWWAGGCVRGGGGVDSMHGQLQRVSYPQLRALDVDLLPSFEPSAILSQSRVV